MNTDPHLWLFAALIVVAISEIILSSTWNVFYFTHGLPIFRRSYSGPSGRDVLPSTHELETALKSRFSHSLVFKEFSPNEYAFREKSFEFTWFHSTPVMHGLLRM